MSFLKNIIDKVEGVVGNQQQKNAQHSSSVGFNPQEQHGGSWSQQGPPPYNPYQDSYQQRGPAASYPYQDGDQQRGPPASYLYQEEYGRSTHNYQGGSPPAFPYSQPPPYENRGQFDMQRQQWGEEHHRDHSPRQFENRKWEDHHEGHGRGRNDSPEEHRYQHHPEGHEHRNHHEHERRRSHSRD